MTARSATATTYVRHELFLGPVHVLALRETEHTGGRATRVSFELNVIDGWIRVREWTDESGLTWCGEAQAPARVRAVLDAAPAYARFIANAHLRWIKALDGAGMRRRAGAQRRALDSALRHHGLRLSTPQQRSTKEDQAYPAAS